jgi:hypothetical protein
MIKTTRVCAGEYIVRESTDIRPSRQVRVCKVYYPGDGEFWIAAPEFDSNTSDPLPTKGSAVATAKYFLETY